MNKLIAVADFETDPFDGEMVYPFCCELLLAENDYKQFWGDDCVEQLVDAIDKLDQEYVIYFHNGGRFDLFLRQKHNGKCLLHFCNGKIKIINRRVVKAFRGSQEIRDSFAVFPERLADFKGKHRKQVDFDYHLMEEDKRNIPKNKKKILEYLHDDCLTLYEHCCGFTAEFGDNLTIGSTATKELRKFHPFNSFTGHDKDEKDEQFREFFFGGRSQCFKAGVIQGNYKIFDVNGMYQHVMREYQHPISATFSAGTKIGPRTDFVTVEAINYGALPLRTKTGVDFNVERGIFKTTIHELQAGEDTGTLRILRVIETFSATKHGNFAEFIDHFYSARLRMKDIGDGMRDAFYKRVMNASYGRFAMNPRLYKDFIITEGEYPGSEWKEASRHDGFVIWERPSRKRQYLNVATAASITGAARAILLRGLSAAVDPVYCDTDSIICLDLVGCVVDDKALGAWKQEGKSKDKGGTPVYEADCIAIAGKKLYAVFGSDPDSGDEFGIKYACKGVKLSPEQIRTIASGEKEYIEWKNDAPTFGLSGSVDFLHRKVRMTAKPGRIGLD